MAPGLLRRRPSRDHFYAQPGTDCKNLTSLGRGFQGSAAAEIAPISDAFFDAHVVPVDGARVALSGENALFVTLEPTAEGRVEIRGTFITGLGRPETVVPRPLPEPLGEAESRLVQLTAVDAGVLVHFADPRAAS